MIALFSAFVALIVAGAVAYLFTLTKRDTAAQSTAADDRRDKVLIAALALLLVAMLATGLPEHGQPWSTVCAALAIAVGAGTGRALGHRRH